MNRSNRALGIAIVATTALLSLDLGAKFWAEDTLSVEHPGTPPEVCAEPGRNQRLRAESVVLVENYMELSYAENCGAAFGLLNDSPSWIRKSVFGVAAVAAAILLFVMFVRGKGGQLFAYSVPLVVSGAVGNLADRVRLGYVIDFIRVHYDEPFDLLFWHFDRFEYPTFNVADITITIGVVLLVLDGIVDERREREKAESYAQDKAVDAEGDPSPKKKSKKRKKKSKGTAPKAVDADAGSSEGADRESAGDSGDA